MNRKMNCKIQITKIKINKMEYRQDRKQDKSKSRI